MVDMTLGIILFITLVTPMLLMGTLLISAIHQNVTERANLNVMFHFVWPVRMTLENGALFSLRRRELPKSAAVSIRTLPIRYVFDTIHMYMT